MPIITSGMWSGFSFHCLKVSVILLLNIAFPYCFWMQRCCFSRNILHLNRKVDDISINVWYYLSNSFSAQSESGLGMLYSPPLFWRLFIEIRIRLAGLNFCV